MSLAIYRLKQRGGAYTAILRSHDCGEGIDLGANTKILSYSYRREKPIYFLGIKIE